MLKDEYKINLTLDAGFQDFLQLVTTLRMLHKTWILHTSIWVSLFSTTFLVPIKRKCGSIWTAFSIGQVPSYYYVNLRTTQLIFRYFHIFPYSKCWHLCPTQVGSFSNWRNIAPITTAGLHSRPVQQNHFRVLSTTHSDS